MIHDFINKITLPLRVIHSFINKITLPLRSKWRGHFLIEASIYLIFIGVIITSLSYIKNTFYDSQKTNEIHLLQIRTALHSYLLRHGHLPNAADLDGIGQIGKNKGYIPYRDLNISKKIIYDANHKQFIYAVHPQLTMQTGKTHIPIIAPLNTIPQRHMITFARLYEFGNDDEIVRMDAINPSLLQVFDGEQNVITQDDHFYIMHPLGKFTYAQHKQWLEESISPKKRNPKYLSRNCIAWVITEKKTINIDNSMRFQLDKNTVIDYETRFGALATVGCPATPQPIYIK
jgi:hypothetical protein